MIDTARLRKLEAKATPGPWGVGSWTPETSGHTRYALEASDQATLAVMSFPDAGDDAANAALIAELRNALPDLLAAYDEREKMRAVVEVHAKQHEMIAEMARRVEAGSPVSKVGKDGKSKRMKFATVIRNEAEASAKNARQALAAMEQNDE